MSVAEVIFHDCENSVVCSVKAAYYAVSVLTVGTATIYKFADGSTINIDGRYFFTDTMGHIKGLGK